MINSTSLEKASMLNTFFGDHFNHRVSPLAFQDMDQLEPFSCCPDDLRCSVEEIQWLMERQNPTGQMASQQCGCFPALWKTSNIVPVPKSSNHHESSNYHPISLLLILGKLIEHHIHFLITEHLSSCHPISESQWGFQVGKSTVSALLATTHDWLQHLEAGQDVCAIFFDLLTLYPTDVFLTS